MSCSCGRRCPANGSPGRPFLPRGDGHGADPGTGRAGTGRAGWPAAGFGGDGAGGILSEASEGILGEAGARLVPHGRRDTASHHGHACPRPLRATGARMGGNAGRSRGERPRNDVAGPSWAQQGSGRPPAVASQHLRGIPRAAAAPRAPRAHPEGSPLTGAGLCWGPRPAVCVRPWRAALAGMLKMC